MELTLEEDLWTKFCSLFITMIPIDNYQHEFLIAVQIVSVRDSLTHSSYSICNFLTTTSNLKPYSIAKCGDNKEYRKRMLMGGHGCVKLLSRHVCWI